MSDDSWGPYRFRARRVVHCCPRWYRRHLMDVGRDRLAEAIIYVDTNHSHRSEQHRRYLIRRRLHGQLGGLEQAIRFERRETYFRDLARMVRYRPAYTPGHWEQVVSTGSTPSVPVAPDVAGPSHRAPPSPQYTPSVQQGTAHDPIGIYSDTDDEDPTEDLGDDFL